MDQKKAVYTCLSLASVCPVDRFVRGASWPQVGAGVLGIAIAFIAGVLVGAIGLVGLVLLLVRNDSGQKNIDRIY